MAAGTAARFISMARAPDEAAATRKAPVRTVMMLGAEKQSLVTNPFHHGPAVAPVNHVTLEPRAGVSWFASPCRTRAVK